MCKKKGFTLIELLIVIAIIAVLLTLLAPALHKAREQARRTLCCTNLHQWGVAIQQYYSDHRRLLVTAEPWHAGGPEGLIAWYDDAIPSDGRSVKGQFSIKAIAKYLPGFDLNELNFDGVWMCPSNILDYKKMAQELWLPYNFIAMEYSYWAGAQKWPAGTATHPYQLTENTLDEDRVLMTDTCFRLKSEGGYLYNHGKDGPSVHHNAHLFGGPTWIDYGPPKITGLNCCYGDGHVEWKQGSQYDIISMNDWDNRTAPRVISGNNSFY